MSIEAADRYRLGRRAAARAVMERQTCIWEQFGEVVEKDFQLASRKFWVLSWQGQLLTWSGDVVGVWTEHFEEHLNTANTSSWQEAKSKGLGDFKTSGKGRGHWGSQKKSLSGVENEVHGEWIPNQGSERVLISLPKIRHLWHKWPDINIYSIWSWVQ